MKKSDRIIAILTETPDLTIDQLTEKTGSTKSATSGLVSLLKSAGKLESLPNPAGGRAKIYRVAGEGKNATPPKKKQKPKGSKKAAPARELEILDDDFICAITADFCVVTIERASGNVRTFSEERTNAIANLMLQQFDA